MAESKILETPGFSIFSPRDSIKNFVLFFIDSDIDNNGIEIGYGRKCVTRVRQAIESDDELSDHEKKQLLVYIRKSMDEVNSIETNLKIDFNSLLQLTYAIPDRIMQYLLDLSDHLDSNNALLYVEPGLTHKIRSVTINNRLFKKPWFKDLIDMMSATTTSLTDILERRRWIIKIVCIFDVIKRFIANSTSMLYKIHYELLTYQNRISILTESATITYPNPSDTNNVFASLQPIKPGQPVSRNDTVKDVYQRLQSPLNLSNVQALLQKKNSRQLKATYKLSIILRKKGYKLGLSGNLSIWYLKRIKRNKHGTFTASAYWLLSRSVSEILHTMEQGVVHRYIDKVTKEIVKKTNVSPDKK